MDLDERVASLSAKDEETLLAELGAWHLGDALGARPEDFGRLVRLGRRWLEQHADQLRDAVCDDPRVVAARAALNSDAGLEAATVADVLTALYGDVGAAVVAVLVTRRGLDRLCGR